MRNGRMSVVLAVALATVSCSGGVRIADTALTRSVCTAAACPIKVGVSGNDVQLSIDELEVKGNKKVRIFWNLDPGLEFDTLKGDGVQLKKKNDGQFVDMFETNDNGSAPTPGPRQKATRFHWLDENSVANPVPYEYRIQFRDKTTGQVYFKDPIIINSG